MKCLFFLFIWFVSCANTPPEVIAAENVADYPCHDPAIKIERDDQKIKFTNCKGSVIEIGLWELKGEKGDDGTDGETGPRGPGGPAGPSPQEQFVYVCVHGDDHIDRSFSISMKDLVEQRWGYYSRFDYGGSCRAENECRCDQCPRLIGEPEFFHKPH